MTTKIPVELSSTPGIVDGSNATAITIDSSERLLLQHTTSIANPSLDDLEVGSGSGNTGMTIYSGTSGFGGIAFADGNTGASDQYPGLIEFSHSANSMQFYTANTERMRIDSSGNLIIGHTSTSVSGLNALAFRPDSGALMSRNTTSSANHIIFQNPNGAVGSIATSGSATAFNTSSDARLKDVTGEARGLEVINALNPVAYNWKADDKADEGLIAQEVLDIVPNAVNQDEDDYYMMDYSKLVTPLIKAIQEQQEQIEQLKTEIQTLKGE